jgi:hypothetical protein
LGLVQRQAREDIYRRAREAGIRLAVYVLDAPREVRRDRVQRRNEDRGATFFMVVPEAVFELASDLWEPPDDLEVWKHDIRFVSGTGHDDWHGALGGKRHVGRASRRNPARPPGSAAFFGRASNGSPRRIRPNLRPLLPYGRERRQRPAGEPAGRSMLRCFPAPS